MEKFAQKCDVCNKGTNEFYAQGDFNFCSEECLLEENRKNMNPDYSIEDWNKEVDEYPEHCHWTAIEDESEYEFVKIGDNVHHKTELGLKVHLGVIPYRNSLITIVGYRRQDGAIVDGKTVFKTYLKIMFVGVYTKQFTDELKKHINDNHAKYEKELLDTPIIHTTCVL